MKFKYSARTKTGELQVGYADGVNKEAAINILNSHDLFVLTIESQDSGVGKKGLLGFFNKVKRADLVVFTRQFATMLQAAIPLSECLKNLYSQTRSEILKEAIFEISQDVDSGLLLSQSLERQPQAFSEFYINLIRSSEVTGQVESAMNFLADYLEKEQELVLKIRNALIYPIFVIALFVIVAGVILGVVFPQLEPIFTESQVQLPWISIFFLGIGNFIASWWLVIIAAVIIIAFVLVDYFRGEEGGIVYDEIIISIPVIGDLLRKSYVARFAEATSVLVKGGIPIAQAIEISAHTINSFIYREALHEIANKIRQGELFSEALISNEKYFPPLIGQMVAVGEKTGRLDEMLSKVYDFYSREINGLVSGLVELIQPVLILFIGGMVGILFASILLPIYKLVQVF